MLAFLGFFLRSKVGNVTPQMVDAFCVFRWCRGVNDVTIDVRTKDDLFDVRAKVRAENGAAVEASGRGETEELAMEASAMASLYAYLSLVNQTNADL